MLVVISGGSRRWQNSSHASCGEVLPYSCLYRRINISALTGTPDCSAMVQGQRGVQKEG